MIERAVRDRAAFIAANQESPIAFLSFRDRDPPDGRFYRLADGRRFILDKVQSHNLPERWREDFNEPKAGN